tara:strand:+ start:2873 stop:3220 length:348 start_codon:yes stop_codon:yes gene_type:complete
MSNLVITSNKTLETLLLNAIDDEIQNNEYDGLLSLQNAQSFNYVDKFDWLHTRYLTESGYGRYMSLTEWFQGLAVDIPFWNDDIENLGLDSSTYWDDLATTLINLISYKPVEIVN